MNELYEETYETHDQKPNASSLGDLCELYGMKAIERGVIVSGWQPRKT
jgi:hypothetical protein